VFTADNHAPNFWPAGSASSTAVDAETPSGGRLVAPVPEGALLQPITNVNDNIDDAVVKKRSILRMSSLARRT
jgi:hypothetical protein